ncbi:response regulator transcription factor [Microbacterium sp. NRRL B-14842]
MLLVDDHALLRAGFRTILDTQPDIAVVGEASTGAEAVAQAAALRPDVITMDVQMPDMDGIEATRRLVADPSVGAAIAIVTTFDRDDYLYQALEAGGERIPPQERGRRGSHLRGARSRGRGRHAGTRGDPPRPHPLRRSDPRKPAPLPARAVAKAPATAVLAEPAEPSGRPRC